MQSIVVLLKRCLSIPKQQWREQNCPRTLEPIEVESLIKKAWQGTRAGSAEQGSVELSLSPDGSLENAPLMHMVQGPQKAFMGVFDVSFVSTDRVKVTLREEACSSQLGTPRRRTRQIGLLRPWKPIRVLLNGRYGSSSGQYYLIQEYHFGHGTCARSNRTNAIHRFAGRSDVNLCAWRPEQVRTQISDRKQSWRSESQR